MLAPPTAPENEAATEPWGGSANQRAGRRRQELLLTSSRESDGFQRVTSASPSHISASAIYPWRTLQHQRRTCRFVDWKI